jgi:hypothetical protein
MATVRKFEAHRQSAPGDFYVVNHECISCGAPHAVAPDLIGWAVGSDHEHCIWKKQPENGAELEQAFAAFESSCVCCYRYAGTDLSIMRRVGPEFCDHAPPDLEKLPCFSPAGPVLTLAKRYTVRQFLTISFWIASLALIIWLITVRV